MKRVMPAVVGAVTVGVGLAPVAAAAPSGVPEFRPCSEHFKVPFAPDAPRTMNATVVSPFGTDRILCMDWHGFMAAYQLDSSGMKHRLVPPLEAVGSTQYGWSNVYFWDPVAY